MAVESTLEIVVVGAGLGGLAAAISCAIGGHRVQILESSKELTEIGAGLQITPNAARLLDQWGLMPEIEVLGAEPTILAVHRYSDGHILAEERDFDKHMRQRYGAPFVDMHRADLQQLLYKKARSLGVDVRLGSRVVKVESASTKPIALLDCGERVRADLVVGADGLWSKCRESMLQTFDKPMPTGDLAYRIVLELDNISDPQLKQWVSNPEVHFWIGPQAHAVAYSMRAGTMYNIVLLCPDDLPENVARSQGSVEEMRERFQHWDPMLSRFLQHVESVEKWKLMHREEVESWTNSRKNFVLIGDSCHPMLPYLAQGANSSLEDGAVLGRLLSYVRSKVQLPWAIELYETLRKSRSESIVRETFRQRDEFHLPDGERQQHRDEIFASHLGKPIFGVFPSRWTCPEVQPWLYGYDSYAEADYAAQAHPYKDEAISSKTSAPENSQKSVLVTREPKDSFRESSDKARNRSMET